jgi:hypothetical protein
MQPAVHLRPDRLRVHAAEAADLADGLRSVVECRDGPADLDHVVTALRHALLELGELGAVLTAAAAAAERCDAEAVRTLRRAGPR